MDGPLDREINEQIRAMMETDVAASVEKIKQYLEETHSIQLNIAITGEPGTGKSTFVNAFRGISNNGEGAAPTGCESTTTSPTSYDHPDYAKVILWDLPGIGSTMWPADKYVERVELEKFDFFIIISADRFRENDVKLVKEIQNMGKKFYFVRSKVNHNLRDEERSQTDFTEKKTLETIIEDCMTGLKKLEIESPQVFLLHSPDAIQQSLKSKFEEDLPDLKTHALRLAMSNLYLQVLNSKKENLKAKIKYYFIISATAAALPVSLLSVGDVLRLTCFAFRHYHFEFKLNTSSLRKPAAITGTSCNDEITNVKTNNKHLKITLSLEVLNQVANASVITSLKEGVSSMSRILLASTLSFITYVALNVSFTEHAEKSHRVFKRALGLNT